MKHYWLLLSVLGLCACTGTGKKNLAGDVHKTDSVQLEQKMSLQPAFEGFEWTELSGSGLRLMAQRSEEIRLLADPSLPGIVMVRKGDAVPHRVIQVFSLKNQDINDVIGLLEDSGGWDKSQTCRFREVESGRTGVRRYMLVPDGEYAKKIDGLMRRGPVSETCNGWGSGNVGSRYFEVYDSHPDKAVFVEIGKESPLFDAGSITLTDKSDNGTPLSSDLLYTLHGVLRLGHEFFSFVPEGNDEEFWIIDKTGVLDNQYDRLTQGTKNGKPVNATLRLEYNGKWDEGFAAEYAGVYFVREVVGLESCH